jgi:hypothetical protein
MSSDDELVDSIKCNLNKRDHFLNEALTLPCGHSSCKNCISSENGKRFCCRYPGCNEYHKIRFVDELKPEGTVEALIKRFDKSLKEIIHQKLHNMNEKVDKEIYLDNLNSILNTNIKYN